MLAFFLSPLAAASILLALLANWPTVFDYDGNAGRKGVAVCPSVGAVHARHVNRLNPEQEFRDLSPSLMTNDALTLSFIRKFSHFGTGFAP